MAFITGSVFASNPTRRGLGVACLVLFLVALALYLFRIGHPPRYMYDEVYHAYTASELVKGHRQAYTWNNPQGTVEVPNGQLVHTTFAHPPLARDIIQVGIRLFGDTSLGWRVPSALFGAFGVVLLFLLGNMLLGYRAALCAAGLLLLDGLWLVQSRIATLDIYLATFLLLAYFFFACYLRREADSRFYFLLCAGAALGLALATKWSAVYSFVLLALWTGLREVRNVMRQKQPLPAIVVWGASFLLLPAVIYLLSYGQYFAMGYSLADWKELQSQMWIYHSRLREGHAWASPWWTWPLMLKPVWYHAGALPQYVEQVFAMGNPLLWWLFLPAVAYLGWCWHKRGHDALTGLVLLGFLGNWLPWMLSPRIAFIYHFLPSVPFGCIAIAAGLKHLEEIRLKNVAWGYMAVVLAGFLFFYPHWTSVWVSRSFSNQHYWLSTWKPEQPDPLKQMKKSTGDKLAPR